MSNVIAGGQSKLKLRNKGVRPFFVKDNRGQGAAIGRGPLRAFEDGDMLELIVP